MPSGWLRGDGPEEAGRLSSITKCNTGALAPSDLDTSGGGQFSAALLKHLPGLVVDASGGPGAGQRTKGPSRDRRGGR